MPKQIKAQEALAENRGMSETLIPKIKKDKQEIVNRPTALDFAKVQKLKELILQDVKRGKT